MIMTLAIGKAVPKETVGETDLYKSYHFFLDSVCIHIMCVEFCSCNRVYTHYKSNVFTLNQETVYIKDKSSKGNLLNARNT